MIMEIDPAWNSMLLTQDASGTVEPAYDEAYYGLIDPIEYPSPSDDYDPYEEHGFGCHETKYGYTICIDPPPGYYNGNNNYYYCTYEYGYGEVCSVSPPYYYYNHHQEPESLASVALFSLSSFMMQIGGLAVYTQSIMDRTDGTNYKGMLLAN